jgi:hypothetical protein
MKKLFVLILFLCAGQLAFAQAELNFEKTSHDFGTIKPSSDTIWVDFVFTNTGQEAFTISSVKTSCDCTLAEWPQKPIQPGQKGVIRGGYKLEGKDGEFDKNIIIIGNTMPATTFLTIKGDIVIQ